jgi:HD-GYP domain-containing protein (c-di-GMP phosphodiesterase class II)
VHVCDVFDALSTTARIATLAAGEGAGLSGRARGTEFDPDLVAAFNRMMLAGAAQVRVLNENAPPHSSGLWPLALASRCCRFLPECTTIARDLRQL